jgi:hypothetical protein
MVTLLPEGDFGTARKEVHLKFWPLSEPIKRTSFVFTKSRTSLKYPAAVMTAIESAEP